MDNKEFLTKLDKAVEKIKHVLDGTTVEAVLRELKEVDATIGQEIINDIKTNMPEKSAAAEHYLDLVSDGPVTKRRFNGNLAAHIFDYRMWLTTNYRSIVKPKIVPQDPKRQAIVDAKIGDKRWMRQGHKATTRNRKMLSGRSESCMRQYYAYGSMLGPIGAARQAQYMFHPEDCVYCGTAVPYEIFLGMGLTPYLIDTVQNGLRANDQYATNWYLDKLSAMGVTADTCSFARLPAAVALAGHYFKGMPCAVFTNLSCDSSMANYAICERELGVPTFYMDHPFRFKDEDGLDCFVEQMKEMIAFVEKHTGHTMDWDKLRQCCEYSNEAQKYELERWELQRAVPPPTTADLMLTPHLSCVSGVFSGTAESAAIMKRQTELVREAVEKGEGAISNVKYRAILWNPPPGCYQNFYPWLEETWGVVVLNDMETFGYHGFIDTSSNESMLRGLAEKTLYAPMARHSRGKLDYFFDDLWDLCDLYQPDFIIMSDHVGCHPVNAITGLFNERCRERGIKVMRFNQDLADVRVVSHQAIRNQVNTFMSTVMEAAPLNPELLNFDDENEW